MLGTEASDSPFVVALSCALVGFGVLVPWLVHESRRPVIWHVAPPPRRRRPHVRLPSLMVTARCFGLAVARRMEPTPDAVVSEWQTAHTAARSHAVVLTESTEGDAARTVNKERARAGEARTSSRSSTHDISSGRRGGLRSHRGPGGRTKEQLYNEAKHKNIKGRSKMNKQQLARAVGR